jgi:hypothetical protein
VAFDVVKLTGSGFVGFRLHWGSPKGLG